MLFLLVFLFDSHRHHRHLHSFSTRRSSDLDLGKLFGAPLGETAAKLVVFRQPGREYHVHFTPDPPRAAMLVVLTARLADRKSTRLNSSHLGISYAVFCLKKKE